MPHCAFRRCNNNSKNTNKTKGVTFHSFPQDPRLKEKWIRIIQEDQRDEEWLPKPFSRVCSAHFKDENFYTTPKGRRKLKSCSIPSISPTKEAQPEVLKEEPGPPLSPVSVSDTDSIFDTPVTIHVKKQLKIEKSKRIKYRKENMKLKKQNKYLKSKNASLRELVKSLKQKIAACKRQCPVQTQPKLLPKDT